MDRDDIIRMAEQAGVHEGGEANWVEGNRWELFANLVAAAERERILDMCKEGLWDGEGIRFHLEKQGSDQ